MGKKIISRYEINKIISNAISRKRRQCWVFWRKETQTFTHLRIGRGGLFRSNSFGFPHCKPLIYPSIYINEGTALLLNPEFLFWWHQDGMQIRFQTRWKRICFPLWLLGSVAFFNGSLQVCGVYIEAPNKKNCWFRHFPVNVFLMQKYICRGVTLKKKKE